MLCHENSIMLFSLHYFLLYFKPYSYLDSMLSPSFYRILRPIKIAENTVIKELLDNPFSVHPLYATLRTVISVGNLLHQPIAPYHMCVSTKDISPTCFGISVPSLRST